MVRTIDICGKDLEDYRTIVPRATFDVETALHDVVGVCDAVRDRGEEALREFSERFDHVVPPHLRVPTDQLDQALADLDPQLRAAFEESIRRRRGVCEAVELETSSHQVELAAGAHVRQRIVPVQRVGLYVPGGLAPLASSVIMNVVAAQVAGVESIAVSSPPQAGFDGLPHPSILALCRLLGVDEVYAVGGAQAIAMFAHGVAGLCRHVDMVTGPGNIYVVAAKRHVRGIVGIDSEAGPTEIAILADETANPRFVAADLMSQAEHDPMIENTTHRDRIRTSLGSQQSAIVLVRDLEQGIAVVDDYAAEHLEIHTANAAQVAARIHNAGAIFVGEWSPVSLGDYSAGSTHVLPTGGAARHSSGLTVRSFMRAMHVIDYDADGLTQVGEGVERFAHSENLPGHANAISVRREARKGDTHD